MSLRQFLPTDSKDNVTTAPTHSLSGRDTVKETESSLPDTLAETSEVATPNYIYYRIFAEDGAIPSRTAADPGNPFLGRIRARSVPPPHTVKAVKRTIAKMENIKDRTSTSLFLTSYSESPMGNGDKVTILTGNRTGPGSTPQEPLAFIARISYSERSALESEGKDGLESAVEPDTAPPEIRYLYYLLYMDDCEMPSKVAINPVEPSLGRIRADSVTPPHTPAAIKRCISRVERIPALAYADLFADISCNTPLKEDHISILRTDCPGLSPKEPMAIVQMAKEDPSLPDGRYVIKNRAADFYWDAGNSPIVRVYFILCSTSVVHHNFMQWDITHDTNGNIFMTSPYAPSSWVGAEIIGSSVPVPWRLIPADGKFYYLTTDMNHVSRDPRVPAAQPPKVKEGQSTPGSMATLNDSEDDQYQMWEFIPV